MRSAPGAGLPSGDWIAALTADVTASNGQKLREPIAWLCEWGMNNREFIDGIIKARAEAALTGGAHKF